MNRRIAFVLALATAAGASRAAGQKKSFTPADVHFVAGMIGHHAQAIQMAGGAPSDGASPSVQQLLAVPGAAQDGPLFRFASDVNVDQTTEINRMTLMLDDLKRSSQ